MPGGAWTESIRRFQGGLIDAINAEISLGTVANINDAVQWLGFTYLFVRMQKNPFIYGERGLLRIERNLFQPLG